LTSAAGTATDVFAPANNFHGHGPATDGRPAPSGCVPDILAVANLNIAEAHCAAGALAGAGHTGAGHKAFEVNVVEARPPWGVCGPYI
jgi:hypothetical protein